MANVLKKIYEYDKVWCKKHAKLYFALKIIAVVLWTVFIIIYLSTSYKFLICQYNESGFAPCVSEVDLSREEKLSELNYLCEILNDNMPSLCLFKERYGIDFNENIEKYSELISKTQDDFEYYCTISGIMGDIPSVHTNILLPDYNLYKTSYGYNYDGFLATWNLKNYTNYWNSLIEERCKQCYNDQYLIFNYFGDGSYIFNSSMGIANYTDEYIDSRIIAIDGINVDEYILNNISYFGICYDSANDKVYRPMIILNSVSEYGAKVTATICVADGSVINRDFYMSCADDLIVSHGCIYDEQYTEPQNENNLDLPYYFHEDADNNLTYAWVSSVDYGYGETIKNKLSEITTDNIILDLRDNGGGTAYFFYKYLYTPLFNNDYNFESKYYIPETTMNLNNIYRKNLVYDIYAFFNITRKYYNGEKKEGIFDNCKIIEETNIFNCKGGNASFKNVYILVGCNTASAADGFVATVKQGTDAVIIGNATAGEGLGGSYVIMSLPTSRLAFSYYPSISFNPNGTNNSVYGTTPDFNVTDFTYEDFNIRNKMIIEYGTAYAFNYENRIQWDNTLYETIAMIKECESSNADKTF